MTLDKQIDGVLAWGFEKGILPSGDPLRQGLKAVAETGEMADALAKDDMVNLEEEIGDVLVTLILLAEMHKMTLDTCLEVAYQKIVKRNGITKNGVFIKEGD